MLALMLVAMAVAADKEPVGRFVIAAGKPRTAALSADGSRVAAVSDGGPVLVWDVATGKQLARITPRKSTVKLAFSPDGKELLTSGYQGLYLWDASSGKQLLAIEDQDTTYTDAMFLPGGGAFAYRAGVFHTADRVRSIPISHHVRGVLRENGKEMFDVRVMDTRGDESLASSPDGEVIAAGWWNGCVRFYSLEGKQQGEGKGPLAKVQSLAFTPDGRSVASVCVDGVVRLWERRTGGERWGVRGHKSGARLVAASPDGRALATAGQDGEVKLWSTAEGKELRSKKGPKGTAVALQHQPNGRLVGLSIDHVSVRLWTVDDGKGLPEARAARLSPREMAKAWEAMEEEDAAAAYRAMMSLAASPGAVAFLRGKVAPAKAEEDVALEAARAVEVLERIGDRDARAVLKTLAGGHAKAALTAEAAEALGRLAERR
jgi:WD40 repeat protein